MCFCIKEAAPSERCKYSRNNILAGLRHTYVCILLYSHARGKDCMSRWKLWPRQSRNTYKLSIHRMSDSLKIFALEISAHQSYGVRTKLYMKWNLSKHFIIDLSCALTVVKHCVLKLRTVLLSKKNANFRENVKEKLLNLAMMLVNFSNTTKALKALTLCQF